MRIRLLLTLALTSLAANALAQSGPPMDESGPAPSEPVPNQMPPPPEGAVAPPPEAGEQVAPPQAVEQQPGQPAGQWVHTEQYGWVWMPYGQQFTYIPADDTVYPSNYVYYPAYGWRWVVAPWVYGWGPQPYWGYGGPRYFVWYSHPWFHAGGRYGWGGYHGWGEYHGWVGPRAWGARGWAGAPEYYRTGNYHSAQVVGHGAEPVGHGAESVGHEPMNHGAEPMNRGPEVGNHGAEPSNRGGEVGNHGAEPASHGGESMNRESVNHESVNHAPMNRSEPSVATSHSNGAQQHGASPNVRQGGAKPQQPKRAAPAKVARKR